MNHHMVTFLIIYLVTGGVIICQSIFVVLNVFEQWGGIDACVVVDGSEFNGARVALPHRKCRPILPFKPHSLLSVIQ